MRQSVPGLREDGRWSIAVSHVSVAVVAVIVAGFLTIAMLTARSAQDATDFDRTRETSAPSASSPAMTQVLSGFGLLSLWFIAGAVLAAKANPGRKLVFGASTNTNSTDKALADQNSDRQPPDEDH